MKKEIRRIVLKLLKLVAFDTTIEHHFTGKRFFLNTYSHKGYWFYRMNREEDTMKAFQQSIQPGDYVLEVGGHIGYITTFFASLVGKDGKVDVFEPDPQNLNYLRKNIAFLDKEFQDNVSTIGKGVGDKNATLDFYVDPISGQNSSFTEDYNVFLSSRENSAEPDTSVTKISVDVVTLDSYLEAKTQLPDFVKIDVESFEWKVIQGFKQIIEKKRPIIMIEIVSDSENIINYFKSINYSIFNDKLEAINDYNDYLLKRTLNIFFKP